MLRPVLYDPSQSSLTSNLSPPTQEEQSVGTTVRVTFRRHLFALLDSSTQYHNIPWRTNWLPWRLCQSSCRPGLPSPGDPREWRPLPAGRTPATQGNGGWERDCKQNFERTSVYGNGARTVRRAGNGGWRWRRNTAPKSCVDIGLTVAPHQQKLV